jgi:hypothetical protein
VDQKLYQFKPQAAKIKPTLKNTPTGRNSVQFLNVRAEGLKHFYKTEIG